MKFNDAAEFVSRKLNGKTGPSIKQGSERNAAR